MREWLLTRLANKTRKKMMTSPVKVRSEVRIAVPIRTIGTQMRLKKAMVKPKPEGGRMSASMMNMRQSMLKEKAKQWSSRTYCRPAMTETAFFSIIRL